MEVRVADFEGTSQVKLGNSWTMIFKPIGGDRFGMAEFMNDDAIVTAVHKLMKSAVATIMVDQELARTVHGEIVKDLDLAPVQAAGAAETPPAPMMEYEPDVGDLRTLWINRDPQKNRFKEFKDAVAESTQEFFRDSSLPGASTALDLCKTKSRHGGKPSIWLLAFSRNKNLQRSDRCVASVISSSWLGNSTRLIWVLRCAWSRRAGAWLL